MTQPTYDESFSQVTRQKQPHNIRLSLFVNFIKAISGGK